MRYAEKPTIEVIDRYADALESRSLGEHNRDTLLEYSAIYMRYMIRRIAALEAQCNDDV